MISDLGPTRMVLRRPNPKILSFFIEEITWEWFWWDRVIVGWYFDCVCCFIFSWSCFIHILWCRVGKLLWQAKKLLLNCNWLWIKFIVCYLIILMFAELAKWFEFAELNDWIRKLKKHQKTICTVFTLKLHSEL